jgi:hypothetical protein
MSADSARRTYDKTAKDRNQQCPCRRAQTPEIKNAALSMEGRFQEARA